MRARRWAVVSAAVLGTVVVGGCSADGGARAGRPAEAASTTASAPDSGEAASASPRQAPATGTARPSDDADAAEQPSSPFGDVPEGYYVVDDGRAMVPERAGDGCEGLPSLEPRTNATEHRVHGYWYSSLRDLGPTRGATGEATYDEDGQPVAYVAAPGDTLSAIADRFCIDHLPYLEWINAVRRGDGTSVLDLPGSMPLYAGDTINLDPYTIATVGDENGTVRDNAVDFHIPPQR